MMTFRNQLGYRTAYAVVLLLALSQKCLATFNEDRCNAVTNNGEEQDTTPQFLLDFTVLSERATIKTDKNETFLTVNHEKFSYSKMFNQAVRFQETPAKWTWIHFDEVANDCLYKEQGGLCEDLPADTCGTKASEFVDENGKVNIGSSFRAFQWPKPNKKEVKLGPGEARGMVSRKYATCTYDVSNQVTTVSEWHFLDNKVFLRLDQNADKLLSARHKKYKDDRLISDERIDYTDYSPLSYNDIPNGLQVGESNCGHIIGDFQPFNPPIPSNRFGFVSEVDLSAPQSVMSREEYSQYTEYNYNSQILFSVYQTPVPGENEIETVINIFDFLTDHYFKYSLTNGNCQVAPRFEYNGSPSMPSPEAYWLFTEKQKFSYLGIYNNRDIPCWTWLFEYPQGGAGIDPHTTITLYLATSDWLEKQGKPRDMFYPVQKISRTVAGNIFESFYEYKDSPGYHIPELMTCFDQNDIITGKITLENTNYYKTIAHAEIHFQYEFRTFLQKITGIKSHLRVTRIIAAPSPTNVEDTDVAFMILGQFEGINSTNSVAYLTDPVTSKQAADKINEAVDKGDAKFKLGAESVTLHLKKGSFEVLKNSDHFENVDHPPQPARPGYSALAMAGIGIGLLVVSLVLSVLAVVVYKRWSEGQDILPSFGMQSLSNEK